MRKLFVLMNVSLDGYFETPEHDLSWAHQDFEGFSTGESGKVDTLLFGRRTYEMMKFWAMPQAKKDAPEIAEFMNDRPKFVASHQSFDPGWERVTVISQDVVGSVKKLKELAGKTIAIFGSNTLCLSLIEAGLIDEFQIIVSPVVLGERTSLFRGLPKTELELSETRRFKSGAMMLKYHPREK